MYAVRLARAATGGSAVLKARGGWHGGNTDLSVAIQNLFEEPDTSTNRPATPSRRTRPYRSLTPSTSSELATGR